METRRRNYATHPRSPPRRKRRTRTNKKQIQQEVRSFFPEISGLPPLPLSKTNSPVLNSDRLPDTSSSSTIFPDPSDLPLLPPSTLAESDLTSHPTLPTPHSSTLTSLPFTHIAEPHTYSLPE
ncbi:hypothetical protein DFH28DRAFT_947558 [Melampsora americana]|nr:hypothetical protein DFH28DRAFT_947558 [Melampsora americana]